MVVASPLPVYANGVVVGRTRTVHRSRIYAYMLPHPPVRSAAVHLLFVLLLRLAAPKVRPENLLPVKHMYVVLRVCML